MAKQKRKFMTSKGIVPSGLGNSLPLNYYTGWGDYVDSQYTSESPFSLTADTDTLIPLDGLNGPKTQIPQDITSFIETFDAGSYTSARVLGINGDSYLLTLDFKVLPTSVNTTVIEFWYDIGGSIGELYRRTATFPKGNGLVRAITTTTNVYTLDTWEANGAEIYIRSDGPCNVYDFRMVISRVHKAR
jgi:hypothetical protein